MQGRSHDMIMFMGVWLWKCLALIGLKPHGGQVGC